MITDLKELGQWLVDNNQDDFGKNINDKDLIFNISYDGDNFCINDIAKKENSNLNYFEKSCFNETLFHSTNQNIIIPSKSNLLGFTPFFIKLDHDFLQRNGEKDFKKIDKFKNKIERSLKANKNNKEFIKVLNSFVNDINGLYFDNIPLNNIQKDNLHLLFDKSSFNDISNLILKYYDFIFKKSDFIIDSIINFKSSDDYVKSERGNFYLQCIFEDHNDLINDFFYFYSKFIQLRSQTVPDYFEGICSICGEKGITYPALPYYGIPRRNSFNYSSNIKNSKLRLCKKCNSFVKYADDKLTKILEVPNILIVPRIKNNVDFNLFLKIANEDFNSFEKINKFLEDIPDFNFDLIIYTKNKDLINIHKYIENYQAFLVKFNNLYLYSNGKLNYLFNEVLSDEKIENSIISNPFGFESIFKEFFYGLDNDNNLKFPNNFYHFYQIYTKDLTGKTGIFNGFDSKTVSIFSKYMDDIFSFIYELNFSVLNKTLINEIALNSLEIFQKNSFGKKDFRILILKRLNYYFMFKKEFLEDNMLSNENVLKLKKIFGQHDEKDNVIFEEITENDVKNLVEQDIALKYYLLGQFIAYIDNFKFSEGKKKVAFSNFVANVNCNNIKKLFVTEILQKNNYYINKMSKKGKFIFKLFEEDGILLFDENNSFDYEDYLLLLFTGYYTQNILSNSYEFKGGI